MSEKLPEPALSTQLEAITELEAAHLARLERTIKRAVAAAGRIAGEALLEIRDKRLYRRTHPSFEAYVMDRWGFSRATAYRMIETAQAKALSRGDTRLPAVSRASRRAKPDPEPSQREASRQLSEARQEPPRKSRGERPDGGLQGLGDLREVQPESATPTPEPTAVERLMPPANTATPANITGDRITCPKCQGKGTLPRPTDKPLYRREVMPNFRK